MTTRKNRNYARFYALIRKIAGGEDMKETLVQAYTDGRTTSLRDMKEKEYDAMCDALQDKAYASISEEEHKKQLKKLRSGVLTRMQKLGLDTTSWKVIDGFCMDPKIAGKTFARLTMPDLQALIPKLEAIIDKPKQPAPVDAKKLCELPNYMLN